MGFLERRFVDLMPALALAASDITGAAGWTFLFLARVLTIEERLRENETKERENETKDRENETKERWNEMNERENEVDERERDEGVEGD